MRDRYATSRWSAGRRRIARALGSCQVASVACAVVTLCGAIAVILMRGGWATDAEAVALAIVGAVLLASAARPRHAVTAPPPSSGERFERGFHDAAIGMVILTPQLEITHVNPSLCALLGRDAGQLVGHSILEFTHSDDLQTSVQKRAALVRKDTCPAIEKRYLRPDGAVVEALVSAALVEPDGDDPYFFSQLQDVTEQRRSEREKAAIADLGRRAVSCTDVMVLIAETAQVVRDTLGVASCIVTRRLANGEVRIVADTAAPSIRGSPRTSRPSPHSRCYGSEPVVSNDLLAETRFSVPAVVLDAGMRRGLSAPVPERSGARHAIVAHDVADGRSFTCQDTHFLQAVAHIVGGALDRAATEDELRRRALEDPLTGLANRALLASQLEVELRHARRLGDRVCLVAMDLDRFKVVNETLGHTLGDALLRQVAARISGCVREEDLVARVGGDEFVVLATRTDSDHAIAEIAQRLLNEVADPFVVDGHELFLTASVGVAVTEQGRQSGEELLRDADAAMYRAKELGGARYEAFDIALRDRLVERMAIEGDLRHAIERDELELHYQPLVDLDADCVVGFEALLRWRHPVRGMTPPGDFIEIAEQTGLIVPIGSWVLRAACEQLSRWPEAIHVSANVSTLQIRAELVDEVAELLALHQITPRRLVLEITESLVLDPHTKPIVASLRELGVQLALDDFGTGYSSLGSLQRFPLDLLKLDRTLIDSVLEGSGAAVVRAAVELGHALGVQVIAEGIEGVVQLGALRDLGCPFGQGFLFARPLPAVEAQRLLNRSTCELV